MSVVANVAINIDGKNAAAVLDDIKRKVEAMNGAFDKLPDAGGKAKGLAGELIGLGSKFLSAAAAAEVLRTSIAASFERSQAETRLKALTTAYGETEAATKLAAAASDKFGITQTEATKAIGDVYGRLRPLGFSLEQISGVYDGFNVLVKQSGISSAEASSVFTQLSQSLGSGTLRGDEFNRMAESMPAILGAVASELKVNQGELRGMAADGKITADVVVRALKKVGAGAKDLDKFLDPSAKSMDGLRKATEDAQVQLGNLVKPVVLATMNVLAKALGFVASNMKMIGQVAVFFGTFVGVIKAIALATQAWAVASRLLANGQKAAGIAAAFLQGVLNPASIATTALALGAATLASVSLGKAMDSAAADAAKIDPAAQLAGQATAAAKTEADKYKVALQEAKDKAKELAVALQTDVVNAAVAAQSAINLQITARESVGKIVDAQIGSEIKLNDLYKTQFERQYNMAQTAERRRDIAIQIFNNEVRGAQLVYQQALLGLKIDNEKAELQRRLAYLKLQEIEAEGKLQILKAKDPKEAALKEAQLKQALGTQWTLIAATEKEVYAQKFVNNQLEKQAGYIYENSVAAAAVGLEQKLVSKEIGMSAEGAANLSTRLKNNATGAQTMSQITGELANRMNQAGAALDQGTSAATANAEAYSNLATSGIESTDAWRERVLSGVGAQQQVATAAQTTTGTIVAANNIRALSATQADTKIVASGNATKTAVVQSNTDAFAGIKTVWSQFTSFFDANVIKPMQFAWNSLVDLLRLPFQTFGTWLGQFLEFSMKTAYALAYNVFVLPWKLLWDNVLRDPVTKMLKWFEGVWNDIVRFVDKSIVNPIKVAWENLMKFLGTKATDFRNSVSRIWQDITTYFSNNVIKPIQTLWNNLMQALPNAAKNLRDSVSGFFTSIVTNIKNAFRGVLQYIANILNSLGDKVNILIDRVNGVIGKLGGMKLPRVPRFTVPAYAEGGVVSKPTLALVGEGGEREYIVPESKMAATASNYLNGVRGNGAISKSNNRFEGSQRAPVINIQTGPVMEINGERYITVADFEQGLRQISNSFYKNIRTAHGRHIAGIR